MFTEVVCIWKCKHGEKNASKNDLTGLTVALSSTAQELLRLILFLQLKFKIKGTLQDALSTSCVCSTLPDRLTSIVSGRFPRSRLGSTLLPTGRFAIWGTGGIRAEGGKAA